MSGKLLLVIIFIYVTLTFLGSTYEQHNTAATWAGNVEGEGKLDYLFNIRNMTQKLEVVGIETPIPIPNPDYFQALFEIFTLRFSFLVGDYEMVWWTVFMPIAMMGMLSIVLLGVGLIRGNITWT